MRRPLLTRSALLALGIVLATTVAALAGSPLKGIDVKLGKSPGGGVSSRTTGPDGQFDFGVVPKGSYRITLTASPDGAAKGMDVSVSAGGRPVTMEFPAAAAATARKSGAVVAADFLVVSSDGVHPLRGSVASPN